MNYNYSKISKVQKSTDEDICRILDYCLLISLKMALLVSQWLLFKEMERVMDRSTSIQPSSPPFFFL